MKKKLIILAAMAAFASCRTQQPLSCSGPSSFWFSAAYSYPHYQKNLVQYSDKPGKLRFSTTKIIVRGKEYELYQISDSLIIGIDSFRKVYFVK